MSVTACGHRRTRRVQEYDGCFNLRSDTVRCADCDADLGRFENAPGGGMLTPAGIDKAFHDAERVRSTEEQLAALRAKQMTEARAREVLGEVLDGLFEVDVRLWHSSSLVRPRIHESCKVFLDGDFTAEQLEALAWWMREKGEGA